MGPDGSASVLDCVSNRPGVGGSVAVVLAALPNGEQSELVSGLVVDVSRVEELVGGVRSPVLG
jgi:hypothetical protein